MSAYSIPKSPKQPSFICKNQNPGVGAYQTNSWNKMSRIRSSPSNSMPKTKKFFDPLEKSQIMAGPGSYNPQKPQTKLFASMKARADVSYQTQAPSPVKYQSIQQSYNVQPKFPSKKYSFGRSNRKFKTEEGPGPASYTLDLKKDGNACSFGKQERGKKNNEKVPGPGAYDSQKIQLTKRLEQYSFPKQKKFITEQTEIASKSKIPGPGAYSIGKYKQVFRGGKFTYGERMTILDKTEGPGPGFYQPKYTTEKKNPRAVIGSQKRQFYASSATPGPGAYEVTKSQIVKKKDGTVVFSHGARLRTEFSQTPGPGSYDTKPLNQSRAPSISSRHIYEKQQKIPGPQDYKPDFKTVQKNEGHTVFGNESRLSNQKNEVPGPGSYQTQMKDPSKTFYFNKSKSKQKLDSNVGPGQYKIKPLIGMYNGIHKDNKDILYV